jgi:hypothetical protein
MPTNKKQPAAGPGRYAWIVGLVIGVIGGAAVALGLSQLS